MLAVLEGDPAVDLGRQAGGLQDHRGEALEQAEVLGLGDRRERFEGAVEFPQAGLAVRLLHRLSQDTDIQEVCAFEVVDHGLQLGD